MAIKRNSVLSFNPRSIIGGVDFEEDRLAIFAGVFDADFFLGTINNQLVQ